MDAPGRDMIGRTIGHYRVLRMLGRGGMGEVYLAQDTSLPRKVALKLLPGDRQQDAASRTRLFREAESAATINHPFICSIHEIGEFQGTDFIAMEYVEGQTLKDRLQEGPFPVPKALPIASEIAEALDKAHTEGVVHRDLKPSNIMLTAEGHPKILDFGLAKRLTPIEGVESLDQTITNLTQEGSTAGTLAYMSPEQVRGQPADARSDIFSFGIVLYEMLTGVHPFQRPHAMETASAILRDEPAPLARHVKEAPELLEHVVGKALAKDPEERYQSARELKTDLRRLVSGHSAVPKIRLGRQTFTRIILATALAVTLGAAVVFWPQEGILPEESQTLDEGPISLVAIPAQVQGPEEEIWRTDAIPESVSLLLAQEDWLDVKVPPTSLQIERVKGDFARISKEYGVQRCLLFSLKMEPNRMLLEVQLADPGNRSILWNESYEAGMGNYNQMVKAASLGVLKALRPSVSPVLSEAVLAATSGAEEAFRQGEYHSNLYNHYHRSEDYEVAFQSFERALELDPSLGEAAAEIAWLQLFRIERGLPLDEVAQVKEEMSRWAKKSMELSPDCGRCWMAFGRSGFGSRSPEQSLQMAFKVVKLDPRDGFSHMALGLLPLPMALEAVREASRLNPFYRHALISVADRLGKLGRASEGLPVIERLLSLDPDFHFSHLTRVALLISSGRLEEASEAMKKVEEFANRKLLPLTSLLTLRLMLAVQSREETAGSHFDELMRRLRDSRATPYAVVTAMQGATPVLARQGYTNEAVELMRLSDSRGWLPRYPFLFLNPDLESLREDPSLEDIRTRSRALFEKTMTAIENAFLRGDLPKYLEDSFQELLELRRNLPKGET